MPRSTALPPGRARPSSYGHLPDFWKGKGGKTFSFDSPAPASYNQLAFLSKKAGAVREPPLRGLGKTKAFLSPASLEAAENAEKEKRLFGEWYLKGFSLCGLCGLCGEKIFYFFSLRRNHESFE